MTYRCGLAGAGFRVNPAIAASPSHSAVAVASMAFATAAVSAVCSPGSNGDFGGGFQVTLTAPTSLRNVALGKLPTVSAFLAYVGSPTVIVGGCRLHHAGNVIGKLPRQVICRHIQKMG